MTRCRCIDITKGVLEEAQMSPDEIDEVILVGGSTRLPFIRSTLSQMFPGKVRRCIPFLNIRLITYILGIMHLH